MGGRKTAARGELFGSRESIAIYKKAKESLCHARREN